MTDARDVTLAAERAKEAVEAYAALLFEWNAPDDEHTRFQLHALVDEVIDEHEAYILAP